MTESEIWDAKTPEVIKFVLARIGHPKLNGILKRAIKRNRKSLNILNDPIFKQGIIIEMICRELAENYIKKELK